MIDMILLSAMSFSHLHLHTEYSVLDGVCSPKEILTYAKECGQKSIAITDHGVMYGVPSFVREARDLGLKPLVGCEAYIYDDFEFHDRGRDTMKSNHITLLAMNKKGYSNLSKLITKAHLEGFYRNPRINLSWLAERNEGIIVLSGCIQGILSRAIIDGNLTHAENRVDWFKEIFGDRFFLEIMNHGIEEEDIISKQLIEYGKKKKIKVVATNDVHFLKKGDHVVQDLLLAIRSNQLIDDPTRFKAKWSNLHLATEAEMLKLFEGNEECVENTALVSDMIDDFSDIFSNAKPIFPVVQVPKAHNSSNDYLRHLAEEGLKKRYKGNIEEARLRLEKEMDVIEELGYPDYFLAVRDYVKYAKDNDIPVGPGRGSGAGCLVAYCLDITTIDPLKYGLIFERFLNKGRKSLPDIDMDFCTMGRDDVIKYIREKNGTKKVSQIITFNRLKGKLAFRDIARLSGIPEPRFSLVAKALSDGESLQEASENNIIKDIVNRDPDCEDALQKATLIENTIRNKGVHAAGLVISNENLSGLVPLAKGKNGEVVSQYEMGDLESMGLVKMDILGIRNLTFLNEAQKKIQANGHECNIYELNDKEHDKKTYRLLAKGHTDGVFQFESSTAVSLLKKIKPKSIEDLAVINALNRPGPLNSGLADSYVKRKLGKEKPTPPHPALKEVLKETLGVMVYQEQVMRIAQELSGYSLIEADDLRKAMGKKIESLMKTQKKRFIDGAKKVGKISKTEASKIFAQIEEFAQYGFPKSHSVAYSVIGFQCAFLKAHFPSFFHAAWLSSYAGNADKVGDCVSRLISWGKDVLPPDINTSQDLFSVNKENQIVYGLASIRNVGEAAASDIVSERKKGGDFLDLQDFVTRCQKIVNTRACETLAAAGAFDLFGLDRRHLQVVIKNIYKEVERLSRYKGQGSLFGEKTLVSIPAIADVDMSEVPSVSKLEFNALESFVTTSPISEKHDVLLGMGIKKLSNLKTGSKVDAIGYLSSCKIRKTYAGKRFAEGVIQDKGFRFPVFFYERFLDQIDSSHLADGTVVIRGRTRKGKDGQVNFYGEYIWPEGSGYHPQENLIDNQPLRESVVLDMHGLLKKENLSSLQDVLKTLKPGNVEIYIDFGDKKFRLKDKYDRSCKKILSNWKEKLEKK
tara:strand:+ start:220 stop:3645 length:3426 start_codon:yes stop_codon:yes gene_type:complete